MRTSPGKASCRRDAPSYRVAPVPDHSRMPLQRRGGIPVAGPRQKRHGGSCRRRAVNHKCCPPAAPALLAAAQRARVRRHKSAPHPRWRSMDRRDARTDRRIQQTRGSIERSFERGKHGRKVVAASRFLPRIVGGNRHRACALDKACRHPNRLLELAARKRNEASIRPSCRPP